MSAVSPPAKSRRRSLARRDHLARTWPVPGFGVALGWLWGAYRLAINRLWGGFDVALVWLWDRHFLSSENSGSLASSGEGSGPG